MSLTLAIALLLSTTPARAQTHWAVGVKSGSMLGLVGLAAERETAGTAVGVNAGIEEGRQTVFFLGRRYSKLDPGNRPYVDVRLGVLRVEVGQSAEWIGLLAIGAGYEAPRVGPLRVTIEGGIGLQNLDPSFTPISRAGIFIGGSVRVGL